MLSVTPTKLGDYLTCPLKYRLRHVDKSGGFSSSAAFSFGTAMHRALQEIHREKNLPTNPPEAEKLLNRYWDKGAYMSREDERGYFTRGCEALKNYCSSASLKPGTEVYMAFVIDLNGTKIRLGCKADRLALHSDDTLEIIDYKTTRSGKVPTDDYLLDDLPTFLYFILTRLTYPQHPNLMVTFLNVMTMKSVSVKYDKDMIAGNRRDMELPEGNRSQRFPAENFRVLLLVRLSGRLSRS